MSSSSWTITPAVVYFHVLPYSEVLSQCISRKEFSSSLQDSRVTKKNIMVNVPEVTESNIYKEIYSGIDSKPSEDTFEAQEQKENNGSCTLRLHNYIKETHEMDVNKSSIYPSQNKEKCQKISNSIQFGEDQAKNNPSVQRNSNGSANAIQAMKVDSTRILINEGGINNIASCGKLSANRPNISYEKDTTDACTKSSNHCHSNSIQFGEDQAKNNPSLQCTSNGSANAIKAMKVDSTRILINEGGINNIASCGKLCANRPNISYEKDTTDACTKSSNHCHSNSIQFGEDQAKNNPSVQCNSNSRLDVNKSSIYPSQNKEKCQKISNSIQFGEDQAKNNPSVQRNSNGSANAIQAMKVDSTRILINESGINNIASCGKLYANRPNISYEKETTDACTKSSNHCHSDREKPQSLQDSKKKLSRTAIASLIRKKSQLAIQQRKIEDEIAICDAKLERLLTDGKDDFESMIECIVEGCNDVLATNQAGMDDGQQ
ncbi:hypothetical protein TSUD_88850 [Trifolium subterraneum]|uniref:DUF7915 domain-containing protein n=1 Tax=Trifolium subterraneum TaxID=3900 RepID=A0A2Z6P5Z7_TRISU|nr:hypothetical protein TSUD_88850 [Trifolium subterraneum]